MTKANFVARQGDVIVVSSSIPSDVKLRQTSPDSPATLALGEVTGHHHSIYSSRVAFFRDDGLGSGYIDVKGDEPVLLTHQEHAPVKIPPGTYKFHIQQEWSDAKSPRRVAD